MHEDSSVTERWLPVVGYEGFYEVSDLGRVRSLDRTVVYSNGHVHRYKGCIRTPCKQSNGYTFVSLHRPGAKPLQKRIHQLVLEAFRGPRPPGMESCHEVASRDDCRLSVLRWDTHLENVRDTGRHGNNRETNKTHCKFEHLLAPPNIPAWYVRRGRRGCLACNRARDRGRRAERAGLPYDLDVLRRECYAEIMAQAS